MGFVPPKCLSIQSINWYRQKDVKYQLTSINKLTLASLPNYDPTYALFSRRMRFRQFWDRKYMAWGSGPVDMGIKPL